jgi:uncharacterized protein (TIGR02246 family)
MRKFKIILLAFALASLLLISCGKEEENDGTVTEIVDKEAIRTEIKLLETNFAEAINNKNLAGLADYYAEDAESYLTGSEVLIGKKAILESTKADFKTMEKGNRVEYTMTDLFIASDGKQAVEMGSYRATNSAGVLQRKGNFMAVFAKIDGKFACIRDIDCPQ